MAFNLMLENGDKLLLENGNGIFLESYVAPNNFITVDVQVSAPVVSCLLRVNTPKFWSFALVNAHGATVTLGDLVSSPPAKFLSIDIDVADPVVSFVPGLEVTTPRHLKPSRHYVWVHALDGDQINVLD